MEIARKEGWRNTWLETFKPTHDHLPDSRNWQFDLGANYPGGPYRWGNNEFQNYTNSTDNIRITEDNTLLITPLGKGTDVGGWTSARIETKRADFKAAEGGKLWVEAKVKLRKPERGTAQGIWPAFWALGENFRPSNTYWPMASEWDIMEVLNGEDVYYSTLHCGTAPNGPCREYDGIGNAAAGGTPFEREKWHQVAFMVDRDVRKPHWTKSSNHTRNGNETEEAWKSETISWWLDGGNVFEVAGREVGDFESWKEVAHLGHFFLLNVAVGGNWPGPPNNNTLGGEVASFEIDYVGVWNSM
ncbi:hypothetical protein HYALB_00014036 [Hymenoscyphus albidus]|uniref:GH16 domain-containing protein n=1 Tax=Hymenoscyphus albidus TaxID=595503 RepID=A0A9N9M1H6_9HELO|nr:hypothetical protein HYALB_00014036 [Hymenoscyphus albidus]